VDKKKRTCSWLFVGLLAVVALVAAWRWWPHGTAFSLHPQASDPRTTSAIGGNPADPRITFSTPFRNVRQEVKYLGDQSCAPCHADLARSYHQHPMGRSLFSLVDARSAQQDEAPESADFRALGFHYRVERRGNRVVHREMKEDEQGHVLAEIETEVQYAVGSGRRGRSFLINHDGSLFQSPITWYPQRHRWDLSPGYTARNHHFARPVPAECLFCHTNQALEVENTVNRYRPPIFQGYNIGCERCHGPGELHVRRQSQGEPPTGMDDTIVNPRRLEPALREAVCEQCHLQGEVRVLRRGRGTFDFRPGLPLQQFVSVFVSSTPALDKVSETPKAKKFVGHVEQMHVSRCFLASGGRMGCSSCHDPHQLPAGSERVAYYRERCLSCHEEKSCGLPAEARLQKSKQDSCIECHMPAGKSDIPHASTTDHRIPRHEEFSPPERPTNRLRLDEIPLVPFYRVQKEANDPESARDLGIALMDRVERYPKPVRKTLGQRALRLLEEALRSDAADLPGWEAKANALWVLGRTEEAAAAFELVLTAAPQSEAALHSAATLAMERERPEAARAYWERALRVNPWRYEFHYGLAAARAQLRDWPGTLEECQRALQLNPFHREVRKILIRCHLAMGAKERARGEFERLLGLDPAESGALRRWYAAHSGERGTLAP
jgi:hypothetical protein